MIRFYFHPTPNPAKVALLLEEAGIAYETIPVDTSKGEQHTRDFRAINPNGKVPAIVDTEGPGGKPARVFNSTAILLYLAEKSGKFLGKPEDRPELLSWLLFIASGLGPFSGQAVHFQFAAPEGLGYAVNRYRREAERHYQVLERSPGRPRLHRRRQLYDRRHVGLGLAGPRRARAEGRSRSAGRLSQPEAACSRRSMRGRRSPGRALSARITISRKSPTRRAGAPCFPRTIRRRCEQNGGKRATRRETAVTRLSDLPPAQAKRLAELECPAFATTPFVSGPPLSQRKIAIVSSAGLFRRGTEPFRGRDSDYRVVPGDIAWADLLTSHISVNFDRTGLQEDWNVAFPLDRMRELAAEGVIGSLADTHYSFMGAADPLGMEPYARELAGRLKQEEVDSVLLTPV